jgi:hypothetical protein
VTDLFDSPVVLIEQPSPHLDYRIADPHGTPLANVTQVVGEQKSALQRFFGNDTMSRVVVQVASPDGAPLFYVDRAAGQQSAIQPPCAVVAPDGSLIGRVEHNTAAFAQSFLAAGGRGMTQAYRLVDAQSRPLCDITAEPVSIRRRPQYYPYFGADAMGAPYRPDWRHTGHPYAVGGRFHVYTDMNGVQIAHVDTSESSTVADRFALQIGYRLPDPLRVLVIASPIAIDLMDGE